MIISDIHGYSNNLKRVLTIFAENDCKRLIVLGDLLTPGPDGAEVVNLLNHMRYCLICMRGNNDNYIYPGECDFKIIDDYLKMRLDGHDLYLTHGHKYNRRNCPFLQEGDIFVQGHSHMAWMYEENGKYFLNPGSVSLPRDHTGGTYIIYDNGQFFLYDLDGNLINFLTMDN